MKLQPVAEHDHNPVASTDAERAQAAGEAGGTIGVVTPRPRDAVQRAQGHGVGVAVEMTEQAIQNGTHRVGHAGTVRRTCTLMHVTLGPARPLLGRVVVVAGEVSRLADEAEAAMTAGASVAVVSCTLGRTTPATVRFNADPRDPDAWERIAMHVEQHLGPVDEVVTDRESMAVVEAVFGTDLERRGRRPVAVINPTVVTDPAGTPPAAPARPRPVERHR